jgi:chromosome segregation ATPase
MALNSKAAQRSGWQRQAERLALSHTTGWVGSLATAQIARRQPPSRPEPANQTAGAAAECTPDAGANMPANKLAVKRPNLAEGEQQGMRGAVSNQILNAQVHALGTQAAAADKRAAELENELAALRDTLVRRETENASLQTSLDLVAGENTELSRRLTEKDAAAAQASAQLESAKKSLAEAEAKSNKLAANVLEAHEKRRAEINAANCRLQLMSSRAAAAEALLAQTRQGLVARAEEKNLVLTENSRLSRCLAESDVAVDTAWSQVEKTKTAMTETKAVRDNLAAALSAASEKYQAETSALTIRLEAMSARALAAENQLGEARQGLAARAQENTLIVDEIARLSRRLAENDSAVEKAWSHAVELRAALNALEEERNKLTSALSDEGEKRQTEANVLTTRLEALSTRATAAEGLLSEARQSLVKREEESAAILRDNERLSRCTAESDAAVDKSQLRIEELSGLLMAAESERDQLATALHAADEKHQRETETLNGNIENLSQRAAAAEAAFAEARQNSLDKVEQLEKSLQLKASQIEQLEEARARLIEAANALLKTFRARKVSLAHAEERVKLLAAREQSLLKIALGADGTA